MKKQSTKWPEKAFTGYVVLMLVLLLGASFGRAIVCLIAFEVLSLPVGWLLGLGGWYSLLPDMVQQLVAFLAAIANGAVIYSLLKLAIRKRHAASEAPIQSPVPTRGNGT